jgi:hypothetical protein
MLNNKYHNNNNHKLIKFTTDNFYYLENCGRTGFVNITTLSNNSPILQSVKGLIDKVYISFNYNNRKDIPSLIQHGNGPDSKMKYQCP